jgi:predicted transcriptional regulator
VLQDKFKNSALILIFAMALVVSFQNCAGSSGSDEDFDITKLSEQLDCEKDGIQYKVGEKVIAEGCNLCKCSEEGLMCTSNDCEKIDNDPISKCKIGEQTYSVNETFEMDCNTCSCTEYGLLCTQRACAVTM